MVVYVGGKVGDKAPCVVASTMERAIVGLVSFFCNTVDGYRQVWSGAFIDGEPTSMRWTTTLPAHGEYPADELYIESFILDEFTDDDDPPNTLSLEYPETPETPDIPDTPKSGGSENV